MSDATGDWLSRVETRFHSQVDRAGNLVAAEIAAEDGSTGF